MFASSSVLASRGRTEALEAQKETERLYAEAIEAIKYYNGQGYDGDEDLY